MIGVDVADGISQQVDLSFRQRTGTTYPLLLQASAVGALYGFTQHNYAVIDHEGVLRYRSVGVVARRFDEQVIRQHIELALGNLGSALLAGDKGLEQLEATSGEEMSEGQPWNFELERNYPNPFNSGTVIPFSLSSEAEVHLQVFDVLGQPVINLVVGRLQTGRHRVNWEGRDAGGQPVPSGIYFYRLRSGNRAESRKMTLLR
ncbi:MAG: T9SS type A sorting domain-containing protein [Gemmatimonadetes bacterium]|nr:T9SS type A sorting domain-containing protein [Gemmatimonadota bacterium]MYB70875.1 T9SS type A sorting domain-containing protein [Gemmatimonadota bacterium]